MSRERGRAEVPSRLSDAVLHGGLGFTFRGSGLQQQAHSSVQPKIWDVWK